MAKDEMIRPEIQALIKRGDVSLTEYQALRYNSWEHEAIIYVLNNEAFLYAMEHCISNCFFSLRRPCSTYNEALGVIYAPELIQRYRVQSRNDSIARRIMAQGCDRCGAKNTVLHVRGTQFLGCDECRKDAPRE